MTPLIEREAALRALEDELGRYSESGLGRHDREDFRNAIRALPTIQAPADGGGRVAVAAEADTVTLYVNGEMVLPLRGDIDPRPFRVIVEPVERRVRQAEAHGGMYVRFPSGDKSLTGNSGVLHADQRKPRA